MSPPLHPEVLDERTASLPARIPQEDAFRDFYLAGETGLALQLGHRVSLDLDPFSERPWSASGVRDAARALGPTTVDLESEGTLVTEIDGVRVRGVVPGVTNLRSATMPADRGAGGDDLGCSSRRRPSGYR